ncbi:No apical meristem (NAM) protein [Corchorus capsularis]|uniref:No apical meristem (NAM) protein n=1 Tax=Corchorus capsularis TaxID=210143 RepID=A0A1R3G1Q1_COCAP|nr:No apical meristem (NAM) protein [Corchorus capsularis]
MNRRAGCGWWDGRSKPNEIKDFNGNLLGRCRYFTYKRDVDPSVIDWVMHEYTLPEAQGSAAAICEVQWKPSKKRPKDEETQSPQMMKKPRSDECASSSSPPNVEEEIQLQSQVQPESCFEQDDDDDRITVDEFLQIIREPSPPRHDSEVSLGTSCR